MLLKHKTKFGKNILSRGKATFLLSLMFVSAVTTLPILQSTNVGAVNTVAGMTVESENKIKSLIYFKAISWCFSASSLEKRQIANADAFFGDWFKHTSTTANVGIYSAGGLLPVAIARGSGDPYSRAIMDCSNTGWVKDALTLWGLDPIRVLCNSGFRTAGKDLFSSPESLEDCYKNQASLDAYGTRMYTHLIGDADVLFAKYITDQVYGGNDPNSVASITGAEWYMFFKGSLKASCVPSISLDGSTVAPATNDPDIDYWFEVPYVDPEATDVKVTMVWYKGTSKKDTQVAVGPLATNGNDGENVQICQWLVERMIQYADDYKDWVVANPIDATYKKKQDEASIIGGTPSSCTIDGIGWIVCPVMNFMAKIVDGTYGIVSKLLIAPALSTDTTDSNTAYKAWSAMRSIANVAFVIAFLVIIFSQLTSVGITNYGIKKMLPRLIIAAILVNLSYFICTIAVDISNILGSSLVQFFNGIGDGIAVPQFAATAAQTGKGWEGIVGGILAGTIVVIGVVGIALYASLSILLPALIAAFFAIVTVLLVLTLRQALIIILIIVSPLAFVAFLLPNTENLFKKWQSLLTTLLLMFPIIAVIFGASALASQVVMTSSDNFFVQIMGALIAIIPLFITPVVMKSAGTLLNQFSGMINNVTKGTRGRMDKGAEELKKRDMTRLDNAAMNNKSRFPNLRRRFLRHRTDIGAVDQNQQTELNRAKIGYVASKMGTNPDFVNKMAQGGGPGAQGRAEARALSELSKLSQEEVASEVIRLTADSSPEELLNDANAAFIDAANKGETTRLRAAQSILLQTSKGRETMHETLMNDTGGAMTAINNNSEMSKEFKNDLNKAGLKGSDAGLARLGFRPGTLSALDTLDPDTYKLNDTEIVGQTEAGLRRVIAAGHLGAETATRILASDTLKTTEEQRRILINEAHGTLPTSQGSSGPSPTSQGSSGPTYPDSGTGTIGFGQGNN